MALESLLYISESTIAPNDTDLEVRRIVAAARLVNQTLEITGALLFTGTHFAQVLEGAPDSVERLMASIRRDPRHHEVVIVAREPLETRYFADWSLAYNGPSQFVSRHVTRLLNSPLPTEMRRSADWLAELLFEFSAKR
ncbi:BLUF domain-containing protein [Sphingomonas sp. RS2018]